MTIQDAERIVSIHCQKYKDSCSPSLCEMLLKLSGAVDSNYYEEQERDKNNPVGLTNITDKTIHGRTFRRFEIQTEKISLFDKVKVELGKGKFLGIYIQNEGTYHGFVIAGMDACNLFLLSKCSELGQGQGHISLSCKFPQNEVHKLERNDCIYYGDVRSGFPSFQLLNEAVAPA